ncbi:energy transducer TonB [Campylobacter coli]|nr:energy transducer TonB [Campylobacter coli]
MSSRSDNAKTRRRCKNSRKIDESGNVLSKELKKSCPYAALNDEALSLFKRASPLPKPPKEMLKNGDKISFVMPIDYNIKDYLGKK